MFENGRLTSTPLREVPSSILPRLESTRATRAKCQYTGRWSVERPRWAAGTSESREYLFVQDFPRADLSTDEDQQEPPTTTNSSSSRVSRRTNLDDGYSPDLEREIELVACLCERDGSELYVLPSRVSAVPDSARPLSVRSMYRQRGRHTSRREPLPRLVPRRRRRPPPPRPRRRIRGRAAALKMAVGTGTRLHVAGQSSTR